MTHAQAPLNVPPPEDQSAYYDAAPGVHPATANRCAYLGIGPEVQAAIGKSTLTDSPLTNPDTSPITACSFSIGAAAPVGREDYIGRDFLSVSLSHQGDKDFAFVVKQRGPGEKVALGDEAYWWESDQGGQLSVLRGRLLITVYTFSVQNPPVLIASRDGLGNIAKKLLASIQQ